LDEKLVDVIQQLLIQQPSAYAKLEAVHRDK